MFLDGSWRTDARIILTGLEIFMKKDGKLIRFLHCSDIHLDTPYVGLSSDKSEECRRELRSTFMRMMDHIKERSIDYVLISGDLFDIKYATNNTAEVLIREFNNCPETQFIIAPGKSDHYKNNPIYTSGRLPANCRVFTDSTLGRFDFEDDRVTIYGWAFEDETMNENPLYKRTVDDSSKINIVCGYCDIDGELDGGGCPIPESALKTFGADYYALGSRHQGTGFVDLGASMYGYSGALVCTGFENNGLGSALLYTVKYLDGELSIDTKALNFGHTQFITEKIDITGVDTNNEIIGRITKLISEKKYGSETALRVELVGYIEPRFIVPRHLEFDAFGLYYFDMIDKTLPLYGTEYLKRDMSVRGEIFRTLLPMLTSENEEDRLVAAAAFREGLAALEGRDIEI